jgi:hypothetical protein
VHLVPFGLHFMSKALIGLQRFDEARALLDPIGAA